MLFYSVFLIIDTLVVLKTKNDAISFLFYHLFLLLASSVFMYIVHNHIHAPSLWFMAMIYAVSPIGIGALLCFAGAGLNTEHDGEIPSILLMIFAWFSLIYKTSYYEIYPKLIRIQIGILGVLFLITLLRTAIKLIKKK